MFELTPDEWKALAVCDKWRESVVMLPAAPSPDNPAPEAPAPKQEHNP